MSSVNAPSGPSGASATSDLDEGRRRLEQFVGAFERPIQRPRVKPMYRLALALVAVAMVILPLIYIGLAVAAAWGTIRLNLMLAEAEIKGRGIVAAFLTVNAVGWIVVFFMFKPLFAPRVKESEPLTLDPAAEPVLHAFVEHLCGVVGAPVPRRIDVDCQVNASASFRRGLVSFLGKDLKLTIGLPLVAGLNLREFTGVLAHEFGHFAQGAGMRLTYIIRTVSHWFARVVYERDAWDARLVAWSSSGDARVMIVVGIARAGVWFTRRVLWVLMMAGHAISCVALRQMEYDADAYETQVAGSDAFESTCRRLPELGAGWQFAHHQLSELWGDRRLCDDVPGLVLARTAALEPDTLEKVRQGARDRKTGVLDTHPADADRIAASRALDAPGVFRLDAPATVLFRDFAAVSRDATDHHYQAALGSMMKEARLESVQEIMAGGEAQREANVAMREVFGEAFMPLRPLWLGFTAPPACTDAPAALARLGELTAAMNARMPAAAEAVKAWDVADNHVIAVEEKLGVEDAGMGTGSATLRFKPRSERGALGARLTELEARREAAAAEYDAFLADAAIRFELALSLLRDPAVAPGRSDKLDRLFQAERCLTALAELRDIWPAVADLRTRLVKLNAALNKHNEKPDSNKRMVPAIKAMASELASHVHALRDALTGPFPFEHAEADMTLGRYIVARRANGDDIGRVFEVTSETLRTAFEVVWRLTCSLSATVRLVERAVLPANAAAPRPSEPADR